MTRIRLPQLGGIALGSALLLGGTGAAQAEDALQIHGFVSQAALFSEGNDFYGESRDGSSEFMEAGINSRYRLNPKLFLSGQLTSRDAGTTDNGEVELDYLFGDLKAVENQESGMGVRLGRVRNNYGFYNDTRDVQFTRPSILMPQAIYFEGNGLREILFASDGAQLYSYWDDGDNSTSLSMTYGSNRDVDKKILDNLFGSASALIRDATLESPIFAQVQHSREGGKRRFALSLLDLSMHTRTRLPEAPSVDLVANGLVASGQLNLSQWSFTAEASYTDVTFRGIEDSDSDIHAGFVQAKYRITPSLSLMARAEHSVTDSDSDDSDSTSHWVVGSQWSPVRNWMISADYYFMRGTAGIPPGDNAGRELENRTHVFAIMLGFRF